jgi:hypothetical protein
MSDSARVRSIDALDDLREALIQFGDRTLQALDAAAAELRRTHEWLDDQERYWRDEIRKQEEAVFLAKQELARRRMMKVGDRHVDCSEQEKALRRAKERLEFAEEKQELTRHWLRQWATETMEFEGPCRQLKGLLESDLVRACNLLENKTEALEAYLAVTPPERSAPKQVSGPAEPASRLAAGPQSAPSAVSGEESA